MENFVLLPSGCNLPPDSYLRHVTVNEHFDNLLTVCYQFQNNGIVFICGDFNSRCAHLEDFIVGKDDINPRSVNDFEINFFGERFTVFLIDTNMCMLNGIFENDQDNFTSISKKR